MEWELVRAALRLLRLEARAFYCQHRRRVQLALLLALLSRAWRPLLRQWVVRIHHGVAAEHPRLHYIRTPENENLLARCESLTKHKYHPHWWLLNGHAQTLRLAFDMKTTHPVIQYERQILALPDGGIVSLDWALPARADGSIPRVAELDPSGRTMLLLPGLTGGSDELYIRCVVDRMTSLGWQVVVLNARGCANTPLTTPQLFSSAYTDDLRYVLHHFQEQYDFLRATLIAVGFSLGSNILVNYLGEEQENALVTAAISVGNPFDLVACSENMMSSFLYRNTYYAALTFGLKELFFTRSNAHEIFRDHPTIDIEAIRKAKTVAEYDERLTCIVFNHANAHENYTVGSSASRIDRVRVPLLCVNAEDDPISIKEAIPYAAVAENPHVILCVTKSGGHLAFYETHHDGEAITVTQPLPLCNTSQPPARRVWSVTAIAEFAESVRTRQL